MQKKQVQVLGVLAIILLFFLGGSALKLTVDDLGYSSAFQGPKARFLGAELGANKFTGYPNRFDTVLNFDADEANDGLPDVRGEMTTIFVPKDSLQYATWKNFPEWGQWLRINERITNPVEPTYTWNISGKMYKMEQWLLKYYVSFSCEWQSREDLYPFPINEVDIGKSATNAYANLDIWLEFDLTPTWYIQDGGTAYFAIGLVQLAQHVKYQGLDLYDNKKLVEPRSGVSVYPEIESSVIYLYYNKFGSQQQPELTSNTFEGKELNPKIFVDKLYAHIDLASFGVCGWNEYGTVKHKGDVATFDFDVRVFVIGEWIVKDIQVPPTNYMPTTPVTGGPSLADYLADPRVQGLIGLLVLGGIFIFLLMFAPWVLFAIVGLFRSGRKR